MRLINARTRKLKDYTEGNIPKYAILSHTWGPWEVTFDNFQDITLAQFKPGYSKVEYACLQALQDGLDYVWIDTCCIDKSSSHELSEAINSMFRWYRASEVCYAYLEDLELDRISPPNLGSESMKKLLENCRWFTRGWTLQEMIAPPNLTIYGKGWVALGTKQVLRHALADITGVDKDFLLGRSCQDASIARRMSWAARRNTTRTEDIAYCLMGIFDVNMPLLYGEGEKAFIRLQEEILKESDDQTLLAWGQTLLEDRKECYQTSFTSIKNADVRKQWLSDLVKECSRPCGVLAKSPGFFAGSGDYLPLERGSNQFLMTRTSHGLSAQLSQVTPFKFISSDMEAAECGRDLPARMFALHCRHRSHPGTRIAIILNGTESTYLEPVMSRSATFPSVMFRSAMFLQEVSSESLTGEPTGIFLSKSDRTADLSYAVLHRHVMEDIIVTPKVSRFRVDHVHGGTLDPSKNQVFFNRRKGVILMCKDTKSDASFGVRLVPYSVREDVWEFWTRLSKDLNSQPHKNKTVGDAIDLAPQEGGLGALRVHARLERDSDMGNRHYYIELWETKIEGSSSFT
jgi:hypothetical protein